MSKNKRGSGADSFYSSHLQGFNDNPNVNREIIIEQMYRRLLTEMAVNRFKWSNLPDSVNPRFLELTLFYRALSVFYYDLQYDKYLSLQGGGNNWLNMEGDPVGFSVVGNAFVSANVSAIRDTERARKAIPIWSNFLRMPDTDIVAIYANKLANFERTIEINSINARRSKYIAVNESQQLSYININRQIDEGQNGIQVTGPMMDMPGLATVDLGVDPKSIETLDIVQTRIYSRCMGLLGLDTANQDKTERLVAGEVEANTDPTSNMRRVNLNAREYACDLINAYYGLNVGVEYWTDEERKQNMAAAAETSVEQSFDEKPQTNENK